MILKKYNFSFLDPRNTIWSNDMVLADSMFRTSLRYNVADYTMSEILADKKLQLNFMNDGELAISLSYLDTLKEFINSDTRALVEKGRTKYIENSKADSNNLESIIGIEIEIAQIEAEVQAEERREKLLKYAQFGGIVIVLGLIIFFLGLRVYTFKKGVRNVMEGIRRANKKFGDII